MSNLKKFVIEYNPRWMNVEEVELSRYGGDLYEQYEDAFKKNSMRDPELKFGDFIGWNNSWWAIVEAQSAMAAAKEFDKILALECVTASSPLYIEKFCGNCVHFDHAGFCHKRIGMEGFRSALEDAKDCPDYTPYTKED